MKSSTIRELMFAVARCALYLAPLPRARAGATLAQAFGFMVARSIHPRLRGKLWLPMTLAPALALIIRVLLIPSR